MTTLTTIDQKTGEFITIDSDSPSGTLNLIDENTGEFIEIDLSNISGTINVIDANTGEFVSIDLSSPTGLINAIDDGTGEFVVIDLSSPPNTLSVVDSASGENVDFPLSASDSNSPTVVITSSESSLTATSPMPITITFSERVTGFTSGDITLDGVVFTAISNLETNDYITWTALITISATGIGTIDIAANVCKDLTGNGNTAATQFSISTIYLSFYDDFTTDDPAPISTPRTCEPGPGTWSTITDTNYGLSIKDSDLIISSRTDTTNPGLWGPLETLTAGLAVGFKQKSVGKSYPYLGWDNNQSGPPQNYMRVRYVVPDYAFFEGGLAGAFIPQVSIPPLNDYNYFIFIHRGSTNGMLYLTKWYGEEWTLEMISTVNPSTYLYPVITQENTDNFMYFDWIRVANLPSPFDSANGLATDILSGSRSQGDIFTHEGDCLLEFICTTLPSSGQHEIQFRKQDSDNYWQVTIDSSGNIDLDEVVAGSPTQRGTSTGIGNGYRVVVHCFGSNIMVGSATTATGRTTSKFVYSSATNFQTERDGSLLTLGTDGAINNIYAFPRTLSGTALNIINTAFP